VNKKKQKNFLNLGPGRWRLCALFVMAGLDPAIHAFTMLGLEHDQFNAVML
jgi:hypothetical protein